jgi:UDP-N-acetylmuramoyl-L-alanyl-D-glutamate--2,6-diaminopimelate ligase
MRFDLPLIAAATERGLTVIDELELGWRLCPAPLVAVTGTNGKSTVCALVQAALRAADVEAPLAGNTLFGSPLSEVAGDGGIVVCEVSSYQLEGCPDFLPEVAVFTNLTLEHLERHGTIAQCGACKARMFVREGRSAPLAAVNVGDDFGRSLAAEVKAHGGRVIGFGEADDADYRLRSTTSTLDSGVAEIETPHGPLRLRTRLPGSYNGANVAAALAACDALGLDPDRSAAAIESMPGVPGRFEAIDAGQPFDVIVDFAHTPDGIARFIGTVRAILAKRGSGRLRVVLGALSVLSPAQHRGMGREAGKADRLILTTDRRGPRQPPDVPGDLIEGADRAAAELEVIPDRRQALSTALGEADPGDLVAILGRGERGGPLFDPSGAAHPFDDREVARELLAEQLAERV